MIMTLNYIINYLKTMKKYLSILVLTFALFFSFTLNANTIKEKTINKEVKEMPQKANIEDIEYALMKYAATEEENLIVLSIGF